MQTLSTWSFCERLFWEAKRWCRVGWEITFKNQQSWPVLIWHLSHRQAKNTEYSLFSTPVTFLAYCLRKINDETPNRHWINSYTYINYCYGVFIFAMRCVWFLFIPFKLLIIVRLTLSVTLLKDEITNSMKIQSPASKIQKEKEGHRDTIRKHIEEGSKALPVCPHHQSLPDFHPDLQALQWLLLHHLL